MAARTLLGENGKILPQYLPPANGTAGNFDISGSLVVYGTTSLQSGLTVTNGETSVEGLTIGGVPYDRYFIPIKQYDNAIDGGPNPVGAKLAGPQGNQPFSPAMSQACDEAQVWRVDFEGYMVSTSGAPGAGMGIGILSDDGGALVKTLFEVPESLTGFSGGFSLVFQIPAGVTSFAPVVYSNGANAGTLTATCEYYYVQRLS